MVDTNSVMKRRRGKIRELTVRSVKDTILPFMKHITVILQQR